MLFARRLAFRSRSVHAPLVLRYLFLLVFWFYFILSIFSFVRFFGLPALSHLIFKENRNLNHVVDLQWSQLIRYFYNPSRCIVLGLMSFHQILCNSNNFLNVIITAAVNAARS